MVTFQFICNLIILIGGAVAAALTIAKFLGVPLNFFKKKRKKQIEKDLEELLPQFFKKYMEEISVKLKEIKEININQNKTIDNLLYGIRDSLRYQIMDIYQRYKKVRKIPQYEKEKLDDTYQDYKKIDGNHYIDKYYRRMEKWEIIPNEEEEI